jgi:hypothetical protein
VAIRKSTAYQMATAAVQRAVKTGTLPPAKSVRCIDCEREAAQYHHHRGYAPEHRTDVVALCRPCHLKRHGRGTPRAAVQVTLRLDPALYLAIRTSAKSAGMAFNTWVAAVVGEALEMEGEPSDLMEPLDGDGYGD